MKHYYSSLSWLNFFVPVIYVLFLMSSVQGQESVHSAQEQFPAVDLNSRDFVFPESMEVPRQNRRHYREKSSTSSSKLHGRIPADFTSVDVLHQEAREENPHFVREPNGAPSGVDLRRHTSFHEARHHSGQVFRQPENTFGDFHDRNHHSRFPHRFQFAEDQTSDSDDIEGEEIPYLSDSSSPFRRQGATSYSEHRPSSDSEPFESENRHRYLQTRQIVSNQHEQQRPPHSFQHRNIPSEFHAHQSFQRDSERHDISPYSDSLVSVPDDRESHYDDEPSPRSGLYENEQQIESLESDLLPSGRRTEQEFIHHSLQRENELNSNPEYVEDFPERPSLSIDRDLEYQDEQQERHEYPPLDVCSEETHTFYNGAISPSSPLYEIEPFLPQNFNEIFLNELLYQFRPYERGFIGDNICNRREQFDETDHTNMRAMCPFEWEVTSFNSSRYPPYLMTARCACLVSKPMYGQRSACEAKKGRIPVLWRVGCKNGKHVYREGWDEINVACIPEGFVLTEGGRFKETNRRPI